MRNPKISKITTDKSSATRPVVPSLSASASIPPRKTFALLLSCMSLVLLVSHAVHLPQCDASEDLKSWKKVHLCHNIEQNLVGLMVHFSQMLRVIVRGTLDDVVVCTLIDHLIHTTYWQHGCINSMQPIFSASWHTLKQQEGEFQGIDWWITWVSGKNVGLVICKYIQSLILLSYLLTVLMLWYNWVLKFNQRKLNTSNTKASKKENFWVFKILIDDANLFCLWVWRGKPFSEHLEQRIGLIMLIWIIKQE